MTINKKPFKRLKAFKSPVSASEYNRLVGLVENIARSMGGDCITDSTGLHIRKRPNKITNISIIRAFCKTDASTGTTLTCYLDTDATGEEVTVNFSLIGTENLNECFPLLKDGSEIAVAYYGDTKAWRCVGGPFHLMDICA